jgi:hypothetical protein
MVHIVTLACRACGSSLHVSGEIEQFACGYCGTEFVVRREGGVVSLAPLLGGLQRIQAGVDKTASELAIQRLTARIADLQRGIAESIEWFCQEHRYPPKSPRVPYRGVIATMEDELSCQSSGPLSLFRRSRSRDLEKCIATVRHLVELLEDTQAQLREHEQIVTAH